MSVEAAFFGALGRDPERKTSQAGREYLRFNVRVGSGDAAQWLSVMVFNDVAELAERLKKDSRVYIEGNLSADAWIDRDGKARVNLNVLTWHCVETHRIGRNRKKRDRGPAREHGAQHGAGAAPPTASRDDFHDDEIPF